VPDLEEAGRAVSCLAAEIGPTLEDAAPRHALDELAHTQHVEVLTERDEDDQSRRREQQAERGQALPAGQTSRPHAAVEEEEHRRGEGAADRFSLHRCGSAQQGCSGDTCSHQDEGERGVIDGIPPPPAARHRQDEDGAAEQHHFGKLEARYRQPSPQSCGDGDEREGCEHADGGACDDDQPVHGCRDCTDSQQRAACRQRADHDRPDRDADEEQWAESLPPVRRAGHPSCH